MTNEDALLKVIKGNPTDEELAAVIAVLSARSVPEPNVTPTGSSGWSAYWRGVRAPLQPGPDAWRSSGRL